MFNKNILFQRDTAINSGCGLSYDLADASIKDMVGCHICSKYKLFFSELLAFCQFFLNPYPGSEMKNSGAIRSCRTGCFKG
jgi:hypothetical protein